MKIAIMGSGGVGGYFGGMLAHAGEDVTFIARGEHLRALRENGLRVESVHGDFAVVPLQVTDDPATVGPVNLVIFATKTYHIDEAARAMRPFVGPNTAVLPLQNGVDAAERTAAILGPDPVLGGACWVVSTIAAPGVIRQSSSFHRIVVGEFDGRITPRVEEIVAAFRRSGISAEASSEINKVRWSKFAFIAAFSSVGAVTRVPAGEIMACAETRALLEGAVREVEAVARAACVPLDPDVVPQTMEFCARLAPDATASMQRDILEARRSELESIVGIVGRLGARLGVPTPVFRFLYAALLPQERRVTNSQ